MNLSIGRSPGVVLIALGLLGLGCSENEGSKRITKEDCEAYALTFCNAIQRCAPAYLSISFGDVTTCKARQVIECVDSLTSMNLVVTKSEANRCMADVTAASCSDILDRKITTCEIPGLLVDGASCGTDGECVSTYCKTTTGQCGVCAPRLVAGGACTDDNDCQSGLKCPDDANPRQCVAPVASGGACDPQKPCSFGLECGGGTCKTPLGAGATCSVTAPCDATLLLFCNPQTTVCQAATIVAAGQPCGLLNGGYTICQAGGTCNGTLPPFINSGTCAAPAGDGNACGTGPNDQDCLSPAVCRNRLCSLPNVSMCN